MTYIEQAIREAIEKGGYVENSGIPLSNGDIFRAYEVTVLDPLFWQALGKARGWGDDPKYGVYTEWRIHWHRFIDHLAEGKPAEDFFKDL